PTFPTRRSSDLPDAPLPILRYERHLKMHRAMTRPAMRSVDLRRCFVAPEVLAGTCYQCQARRIPGRLDPHGHLKIGDGFAGHVAETSAFATHGDLQVLGLGRLGEAEGQSESEEGRREKVAHDRSFHGLLKSHCITSSGERS